MSQFGRVDILVNGAAGNFLAEAKSLTPSGFKTVMDIDAQGTFNMSHAIYPAMITSGDGGAIINISMTLHYGGEKSRGDVSSSLPLGFFFFNHCLRQQLIFLLCGYFVLDTDTTCSSYVVSGTCVRGKERNRFTNEKFGLGMGKRQNQSEWQ